MSLSVLDTAMGFRFKKAPNPDAVSKSSWVQGYRPHDHGFALNLKSDGDREKRQLVAKLTVPSKGSMSQSLLEPCHAVPSLP